MILKFVFWMAGQTTLQGKIRETDKTTHTKKPHVEKEIPCQNKFDLDLWPYVGQMNYIQTPLAQVSFAK